MASAEKWSVSRLFQRSQFLAVALSPDGKRVASGGTGRTVRVWDASTGKDISSLAGHRHFVTFVAFSADSKRIISGSGMIGELKVWEPDSETELMSRTEPGFLPALLSPDGERIFLGDLDGVVRVLDASSLQELLTISGGQDELMSLALSSDGRRLASGSTAGTLQIWDTADRPAERPDSGR